MTLCPFPPVNITVKSDEALESRGPVLTFADQNQYSKRRME